MPHSPDGCEPKMKCPRCNSEHIVKAGFKVTVSRGRVQMYKCMGCGHVFSLVRENA